MYDMARLLAQDYSDESARVFVQMALYLNPGHTRARFLLAHIAARNDRSDEAIAAYEQIPPSDGNYAQARRAMAELLAEMDDDARALAVLKDLVEQKGDVEALVQMGDIYRLNDDFTAAIKAYDEAQELLSGEIDADHWHIHYLRGMAYEQNKQWKKAEGDLKAALEFQPDHPYVLNYLGYAWADQGLHLPEAEKMIRRAVELQPQDGYITDSLGWVLYRMGQFKAAVPHLEQAVELLPYDPTINDHLGDAYWQVGRRLEARFQWERARNYAQDDKMRASIDEKLKNGLTSSAPQIYEDHSGHADIPAPNAEQAAQNTGPASDKQLQ
jgi:tetratricopeptide (TPR) repeat protein